MGLGHICYGFASAEKRRNRRLAYENLPDVNKETLL
jgi:hypothetical protein